MLKIYCCKGRWSWLTSKITLNRQKMTRTRQISFQIFEYDKFRDEQLKYNLTSIKSSYMYSTNPKLPKTLTISHKVYYSPSQKIGFPCLRVSLNHFHKLNTNMLTSAKKILQLEKQIWIFWNANAFALKSLHSIRSSSSPRAKLNEMHSRTAIFLVKRAQDRLIQHTTNYFYNETHLTKTKVLNQIVQAGSFRELSVWTTVE